MSELKITKKKVLEAAEKCGEAKDVLQTLFPSAFAEDEIKVGDTIVVANDHWEKKLRGKTGRVMCYEDPTFLIDFGEKLMDDMHCGHTNKIRLPRETGWWIDKIHVKKIEPSAEPDIEFGDVVRCNDVIDRRLLNGEIGMVSAQNKSHPVLFLVDFQDRGKNLNLHDGDGRLKGDTGWWIDRKQLTVVLKKYQPLPQ